jgi:formate hydrogenlyase transcriptional activator
MSADLQFQLDPSKYRSLLAFSEALAGERDLPCLFKSLAAQLRALTEFDVVDVVLYDPAQNLMRRTTLFGAVAELSESSIESSAGAWVLKTQQQLVIADILQEARFPELLDRSNMNGIKSYCILPLTIGDHRLGAMEFGGAPVAAHNDQDLEFWRQIANRAAGALDNAMAFEDAHALERELRLLLEVNNSVVSHLDLQELFTAIGACLRRVIPHDASNLTLYDAATGQLRVLALDSKFTSDRLTPSRFVPLEDTPGGTAFTERRTVLVRRRDLENSPSPHVQRLVAGGLQSGLITPLISHGRALGTIGLGSLKDDAFSESDAELMTRVAAQVAIAVDNALNFERAREAELEVRRQYERQRLMLEINNAVVSQLSLHELVRVVSSCLRDVLNSDVTGLSLYDPETNQLRAYVFDLPKNIPPIAEGTPIPFEGSMGGRAFTTGQPVFLRRTEIERASFHFERGLIEAGIKSGGCTPLVARDRKLGVLGVGSFREDAFSEADQELLGHIANQIAIAVENALAYREIETLKNKLAVEKLYLEEEINTAYNFEEIIGSSPALKRILKQAETVAPTDSTVLIQGETGTGKELMARAIHSLSQRRERMMVKLNCAAIPTGLLESELFGHEKGSFTGAIAQRIGRFELAHKGSFFLDEVGEIPSELQPKLLRVLQEQEFERLGSARTQRVDVRLIAATNRDLTQMVAENKFRSDLYYRLHVFPIVIPPLRERPEDIPLLARFFANKFSARMKKQIKTISAETVAALQRYHWPGNIREFENTIERAVILTQGAELQIPLPEIDVPMKTSGAAPGHASRSVPGAASAPASTTDSHSLKSIEREHILRVLAETGWVIGGPAGAAVRLGMKRTTLQARMQKLGITRQR